MSRLAVVLFNLGGPDSLKAVKPFLFNLFRDKAILQVPAVVRYPLAALIASGREKAAQANYTLMGGASPLLPETWAQAEALEVALAAPGRTVKVFIAMRYWAPRADETARAVAAFQPDDIVLAPLYPQFSTTTTASSLDDWRRMYRGPGRSRTLCCYPTLDGLVAAHARAIEDVWDRAGRPEGVRLLFSAHGLPEKVVAGGDPYQAQIEATATAVAAKLSAGWDWRVCYQSRVGPLRWLGPSTDEEVRHAGAEGKGVLVVPIAFVSEHVETLVELDHEYAALATSVGCAPYLRAPALRVQPAFINGLARAIDRAARDSRDLLPGSDWSCPTTFGRCPLRGEPA